MSSREEYMKTKKLLRGYEEFQERIMQLRKVMLVLTDEKGTVAKFEIRDTWKTAFPRSMYAACAQVSILDHFKLQRGAPYHNVDVPEATALYGIYEGSGPFVSQVNYISCKENGFTIRTGGGSASFLERSLSEVKEESKEGESD
jgi:hypothetical protein